MPELPDVATFQKTLETHGIGRTVKQVHVPDERILDGVTPQVLGRRLKNHKLSESRRHGKYLFAGVDNEGWLVMHFGMTGTLEPGDGDDDHEKAVLELDDGEIVYRCTRMLGKLGFTDDLDSFIADEELGPDALADDLDQDQFVELLSGRHGALKSTLMNQNIIAGIGNVWSDELLFRAGIRPNANVNELDESGLADLYRTMRETLEDGVKHTGNGELPDRFLVPHRHEDGECPKCGEQLMTTRVSGRRAYYCPKCQQ